MNKARDQVKTEVIELLQGAAMTDHFLPARQLRFAIVHSQLLCGNLTRAEAESLLARRLSPDNPMTQYDDSQLLNMTLAQAKAELGLVQKDVQQ